MGWRAGWERRIAGKRMTTQIKEKKARLWRFSSLAEPAVATQWVREESGFSDNFHIGGQYLLD